MHAADQPEHTARMLHLRIAFAALGEQVLEFRDPLAEHLAHTVVDRGEPEVLADGDAQRTQIHRVHLFELLGVHRCRERVATVISRHRREHQTRIDNGARHRSLHVVRGEAQRTPIRWHQPGRATD